MGKKVPFKEQMNESECGLACIAMICSYYGKHIDIVDTREFAGNVREGLSMLELSKIFDNLGMDVRAYKVNVEALKNVTLPAIIHWNFNHFVVLEKVGKNNFFIIDPDLGRQTLKKSVFKQYFSGSILIPEPNESFTKRKKRSLWKPYLSLLLQRRSLLFTILLVSLFLQSFVLLTPILTQFMIDSVTSSSETLSFSKIGLLISISFIFYFAFNIVHNELTIKFLRYLDFNLSWKFFSHLINIPFSFFETRNSGDLLYRFSNLRSLRDILSSQIIESVLNLILIITIFSYMLLISPKLALLMLTLTLIFCSFIYFSKSILNNLNRNELSQETKLFSIQGESIYGIHDIKAGGLEQTFSAKWNTLYQKFANAFVKRKRMFGFVTSVSRSLTYFIPVTILLIGLVIVTHGEMTIGELVAFQSISTYFVNISNSLIMQLDGFYQIKVYLTRLQDVFKVPTEDSGNRKLVKHYVKGKIKFNNVSFSYGAYQEDVINNVSFEVNSGEKIAIVGKSGSGKSTLANLLVGLHEVKKGEILYDNVPIHQIDKQYLRKQIGIVTQTPYLFNQTIYENITGNSSDVDYRSVINAAKIAQIHDEIMQLPLKYNTIISEQGQNFSGGQKQRIAIARAIVNKPKIIILDEATNSLDSITEKKLSNILHL